MSSARTPRTVEIDPPADDMAGSEDNDSRLLVDDSDAPIETGKNGCARRRVGLVAVGMIALGLIALWSHKLQSTSRSTITREEYQAQMNALMRKFDVLNPYANFNFSNLEGLTMGSCVIDADEANAYFGKFLVASGKAQDACSANKESTDCITDVLEIFSSLGFMGDFIASAATQCGLSTTAATGCTAEVLAIASSLADVGRQGLEINRSCVPATKEAYQLQLDGEHLWNIDQCLLDVDLLSAHFVKGGVLMGEVVEECKNNTNNSAGKLGCAVDILDIISQVGGAGTFLSAALVDCAPSPMVPAVDTICAEAITDIVGETFGIASSAAVLGGCAAGIHVNQTS